MTNPARIVLHILVPGTQMEPQALPSLEAVINTLHQFVSVNWDEARYGSMPVNQKDAINAYFAKDHGEDYTLDYGNGVLTHWV